jgi:hypothetical protein
VQFVFGDHTLDTDRRELRRGAKAIAVEPAAGMAGEAATAAAALQELRRAQPNISLAWIAKQMPIKEGAEMEHYLEGFRRAGLE